MRLLHLASFEGNLGDNANIDSLHRQLRRRFPIEAITRLEMREFYWGQRGFDERFAEDANRHDLVIVGGGNYFEVWVESSCSGMSVAIPYPVLERIATPMLFYGLGFDPDMGYSASTLDRSRRYFEYLLARPDKYLVTVRNDGSRSRLRALHGAVIAERVGVVPDGGFFLEIEPQPQPWLPPDAHYLAINLAGDMLELRHPGGERLNAEQFHAEFAAVLADIAAARPQLGLVFVPHIYRDLQPISAVLDRLPDPLRRRSAYVAPYTHGTGPHQAVFDVYARAACVLGVRFHANVCPIALGTPTIGLVNYPQIEALYREIGIPERACDIRVAGFGERLAAAVDRMLADPGTARAENHAIRGRLERVLDGFLHDASRWLAVS